jgi:hypothetical protein
MYSYLQSLLSWIQHHHEKGYEKGRRKTLLNFTMSLQRTDGETS